MPVADRTGKNPFALESVDLRAQLAAGRDLQTRILDALRKHVFDSLTPSRLVSLTKLGESRGCVAGQELVKWFFSYFDFPKIKDESPLKMAIARGTQDVLGYVSAAHVEDGKLVASRKELVRFGAATREDEIDLGPGCFVAEPRLATELRGEPEAVAVIETPEPQPKPEPEPAVPAAPGANRYRLSFRSDAEQLFRVFPALQNLADKASTFTARIEVEAESETQFDRAWLRNAVEEQLNEAGVDAETLLE